MWFLTQTQNYWIYDETGFVVRLVSDSPPGHWPIAIHSLGVLKSLVNQQVPSRTLG